jgi:hypothetical protein
MAAKSQTKMVELHVHELEMILDQVEEKLGADKALRLRQLLQSHLTLMAWIQEKNLTLARLRRLLFGSQTERTSDAPCSPGTSGPSAQETVPPKG